VCEGAFEIEESAAVAETVGRHVQDAHDERAPAERERAAGEFPFAGWCHREILRRRARRLKGEAKPAPAKKKGKRFNPLSLYNPYSLTFIKPWPDR
jgi:hypothetical protein